MKKTKIGLTIGILAGLVLGAVVGQLLYDSSWNASMPESAHQYSDWLSVFEFLGSTLFIGLLKVLIIPLIAASVVVAVTSVGDFGRLGKLGGWTLVYYVSTMFIAVSVGLVLVNVLNPGQSISDKQFAVEDTKDLGAVAGDAIERASGADVGGIFANLVKLFIPENIFHSMAQGETLAVIAFFIFFGVMLLRVGEKARVVIDLAEGLFEVLMRMVAVVLWLAPIGVFCLLALSVSRVGLGVFSEAIGMYMITILVGLGLHGLVVLPLILWGVTKENPFRFLYQMKDALLTALGTDSSSATLPVTIECATEQGGVSRNAAGLVLPLGATINMDGTALYEAVAVVFLAQAYGIELGGLQMVLIAVTATLAAIGAAGIPSAGLVTMLVVVAATNDSLIASNPQAALIPVAGIGLIIGVDRILDMVRTMVNVWGDAVGAKIITAIEGAPG